MLGLASALFLVTIIALILQLAFYAYLKTSFFALSSSLLDSIYDGLKEDLLSGKEQQLTQNDIFEKYLQRNGIVRAKVEVVMHKLEERRQRDTIANIGMVQKVKKDGGVKVELQNVWLVN